MKRPANAVPQQPSAAAHAGTKAHWPKPGTLASLHMLFCTPPRVFPVLEGKHVARIKPGAFKVGPLMRFGGYLPFKPSLGSEFVTENCGKTRIHYETSAKRRLRTADARAHHSGNFRVQLASTVGYSLGPPRQGMLTCLEALQKGS